MRHPATCIFSMPRCGRGRPRRTVTAFVSLALTALITGCGATGTRTDGRAAGASPPGFPVTVTNCGVSTTYQRPPQRVVATGSTIDTMFALGLGDRLIGTAYSEADSVLPRYRRQYREIPSLGSKYPSYEALLKAAPDFVYGGHGGMFSKQEGRSRKRLGAAGIHTFLNTHECSPGPTTMKHLWGELRTLGTVFGVEQRAQHLVERLRRQVAETERALAGVDPVSVFVYDSGTKVPMTAGGGGIGNEIIRMAGGRNIFAGVDDEFFDASWEQVVQRRPEWIVIMDYGSTSVEQKKQTLLNNPALAEVPAVKHRRFAVLPLSSAYLGVRAPKAVAELGRPLHPGRFR